METYPLKPSDEYGVLPCNIQNKFKYHNIY